MKIRSNTIARLAASFLLLGALSSAATHSRGALGRPPRGLTASVEVTNFQFSPKQITVKAGTTVVWTNREGTHTIEADKGTFSSPTLNAGQTFSRKFTKPGTYPYHCSFHGSAGGGDMAGTVVVTR